MEAKHLRVLYIFKSLTDDELKDILGFCKLLKLIEGAAIIREGDKFDGHCYGLMKGRLQALKAVDGQPDKELGEMKQGDVIGELAIVLADQHNRTATVKAMEDSLVAQIDAKKLQEFMDAHIPIGYKIQKNIMAVLAARLKKTTESVSELMFMGALSGNIRYT